MGFLSTSTSSTNSAGTVPIGGYADVFSSGDAYKPVGSLIQRSLYPKFSNAFPRRGAYSCIAQSIPAPPQVQNANQWFSIAYGNGLFVAFGGYTSAPTPYCVTSPDGINWTTRTLPIAMEWKSVAFGNGLFVASGSGASGAATNIYLYSIDGITWTQGVLPVAIYWGNMAFSTTRQLFVAIGGYFNASSNAALSSSDGKVWASRTMPSAQFWRCVTASTAGTFVAVSGTANAAYSLDGQTWVGVALPDGVNAVSVTYGNGLFVATGAGCATSPDGITWTLRTIPTRLNTVSFGNGVFVGVGPGAAGATSIDGITWTLRAITSVGTTQSMTFGAGTFVAITNDSTGMNAAAAATLFFEDMTSSDYMYISGTTGKFVRVK